MAKPRRLSQTEILKSPELLREALVDHFKNAIAALTAFDENDPWMSLVNGSSGATRRRVKSLTLAIAALEREK